MKFFRVILWTLVSAILLVMVSGVRAAEISVKDVWIRATVDTRDGFHDPF